MSKDDRKQSVAWLTPWFVARYPKISTPDTKGKYADGKFKTDGVFLDAGTLKEVEKHLAEVGKQFWPEADEVKLPIRDFFKNAEDKKAKKVDGRGITLKSKNRPAVFDSKQKKLPDSAKIGGGSIIRVAAGIAPYTKTEKMKVKAADGTVTEEETTVFGITLYLNDVQVKKYVPFTASGDGSAFSGDEVEDGFEYEDDAADEGGKQFGDATDL
jgi:hypothetical protein